jgi:chromosomal replication initiation ATPase DnaA
MSLPLNPDDVIMAVASAYHLRPAQLLDHDQTEPARSARRVAYALLHQECGLGWFGVARYFDRDPSTVRESRGRLADPEVLEHVRARLRGLAS